MKCLQSNQIYLYLEKNLADSETSLIRKHLKDCPQCWKAVQERKIFTKAAESLPSLKLPPDFSSQVMEKIFPLKIPIRASILAVTVSFSFLLFALFIYFLRSGQNLIDILIDLNHSVLYFLKDALIVSTKLSKLALLLIKVIYQCFLQIFNTLSSLASALSTETKIILITLTLAIITIVFFGFKKKTLIGELYE